MGALDERRVIFEFDHVASMNQSEDVAEHIQRFVPDVNPYIESSHKSSGVQAADCFAGAVAEDYKRNTSWLEYLESRPMMQCSEATLVQLENQLVSYTQ